MKATDGEPINALLVNAHPDDESESAAVVYRITHELGGTADQFIVTNGESGHRYAALAEAFYRLPLTSAINRRELLSPIRREEAMRAGRILGIRHNYFLDQRDTGVTLNANDALEAWDVARVRQELRTLLEFEQYSVVFILLPTSDTHGHHQTVAALTLEAVAQMEVAERPAVLGVRTLPSNAEQAFAFSELHGYPLTRTTSAEPFWSFDRSNPLACHAALNYSIVVNWVIAEHKSQGIFQLENGRRTHEEFWLFAAGSEARARDFVRAMEQSSVFESCAGAVA